MSRQPKTHQPDLFSSPRNVAMTQMPHWHALPEEARRTLTTLLARLILDHVDGDRTPGREEMRHDV
jgi:hypothetical protein